MSDDWDLQKCATEVPRYRDRFTVLGLLGPAGSGKDLVADWLCNHGFVKVAFADPIKRFAMKCFTLDPDSLWGPSEKRNQMLNVNEMWWMTAIGNLPHAQDEIINKVLEQGDRVTGYLKLMEWLTGLRAAYREQISARVILQTLGTEWGRSVDPLMWAKYAHKTAFVMQGNERTSGLRYDQKFGIYADECNARGVVIPDHRFQNEVALTQAHGGYVLRLRRLALEKKEETVGIAGHRSEAEQKTIPDEAFDHVFNFPEGVEKVYEALQGALEQKLWKNTRGRS